MSVLGRDFQETKSVWEGMKQIPLLRIIDGTPIKVTNKVAVVEINGTQMQMDGVDLESYLKTLDPKSIKKIIINSNPDASYGSEVNAVVNILLQQRQGSYQVGLNTTNGIRNRYNNTTGANYGINTSKVNVYANYNFEYLPTKNTANVQQKIGTGDPLQLDYFERNVLRNHKTYLNIKLATGEKDDIDITGIYSIGSSDKAGLNESSNFNRNINIDSKNRILQFAEVWKHNFNDSISLKIGGYQVFKKNISKNVGITNSVLSDNQNINTNIPIYIGFANYSNQNRWGETTAGLRYHNIQVNNENNTEINNQVYNAPFNYSEQVIALYLNHSIEFSRTRSLSLGIRSESSFIDYMFSSIAQKYENTKKYTNLLYNMSYDWKTSKNWNNNISLRKQIQRPNYSYLNPFKSISSDLLYLSGDSEIIPAKNYTLSFQTIKNKWAFYSQLGVAKDFISSFYKVDNNNIVETYKNFKRIYVGAFGAEYNSAFFKRKLVTKISTDFQFVKIDDPFYNTLLSHSTPIFSFGTNNIIDLGHDYKFNINYNLEPSYKDGLIKHHTKQKLDISLSKRLNSEFSILIFAYDIFKTNKDWEETTVPFYFHDSNYYNDTQYFGLTLKWNITGNAYKSGNIEKPVDNTLDRL